MSDVKNAREEKKFTRVCAQHSFTLVSESRNEVNALVPDRDDARRDVLNFERVSADGRVHRVRVYLGDGSKSFIFWYRQKNDLLAPVHGDNSNQLDRALTRETF